MASKVMSINQRISIESGIVISAVSNDWRVAMLMADNEAA